MKMMNQPAAGTRTRAARQPSSWHARLAPVAIAAIVIASLCFLRRPFPVGIAQDDGLYVILAKALATGQGFRFINLPGAPAGVHFPPGYPLLLASLWRLSPSFPANVVLFAVANVVLLGVAAGGAYVLARRFGLLPAAAAACALAGFLMPPALWMNTVLISEPLWLALAILWLLWAEATASPSTDVTPITAVALGASAGAIALVRTQAGTLVLGLLVVLAVQRRWKPALWVLVGASVVLLPWQLWMARHVNEIPPPLSAKYGAYAPWLIEGLRVEGIRLIVVSLRRNIGSAAVIVGSMFALPSFAWAGVVLLLAPAVAGTLRLMRHFPVLFVTLAAHAAIILALPWDPRRYVWTSWPFVALWIAAGLLELWQRLAIRRAPSGPSITGGRWRVARTLAIANGALLIAGGVLTTGIMLWTGAYRNIATGQARRIAPTVEWVRRHTDSSVVVASDDETAVFLYTGRRAVPTASFSASSYARPSEMGASVLDAVVARYQPDLVIVSWTTSLEAAMRLASGPQPILRLVDRAEGSVVFEQLRK
jgi:hypothetical protein